MAPNEINGKTKLPIGLIVSIAIGVIPTIGWIMTLRAQVETHMSVDEQKWLRQADGDKRRDEDIAELRQLMRQNVELMQRLLDRETKQAGKP